MKEYHKSLGFENGYRNIVKVILAESDEGRAIIRENMSKLAVILAQFIEEKQCEVVRLNPLPSNNPVYITDNVAFVGLSDESYSENLNVKCNVGGLDTFVCTWNHYLVWRRISGDI
jgi:hypothetical protein